MEMLADQGVMMPKAREGFGFSLWNRLRKAGGDTR